MKKIIILNLLISFIIIFFPVTASAEDAIADCSAHCTSECDAACDAPDPNHNEGACNTDCNAACTDNTTLPSALTSTINAQCPDGVTPVQYADEDACDDDCNDACEVSDVVTEEYLLDCKGMCQSDNCSVGAWMNSTSASLLSWIDSEFAASQADAVVNANTNTTTSTSISVGNPLGGTMDPRQVISNVISVVLIFLGVITLIVFIIAGFMMMFSGGNEETFKKSRTMMIWAVIGLAITLASYAILDFLFSTLIT